MNAPICQHCDGPVHRDPVLFRAEAVHKLCELAAQAKESEAATESLFARLGESRDAVEWDTSDTG